MQVAFYACALVALLATMRVITNSNPIHALLYLVVSLLSVAGVFFALGAPFAGALEVIVYAGAIMVLFVFVVMMLNLGESTIHQERDWMKPSYWIGPGILSSLILVAVAYALIGNANTPIGTTTVDVKKVGIALYGPYLLVVELASMLLLGALVASYHLGRNDGGETER